MGPHLTKQFREDKNTLVGDFERSDPWDHDVALIVGIVAGDQLAVTVFHSPDFGNCIGPHINLASVDVTNGFGNYNRVGRQK